MNRDDCEADTVAGVVCVGSVMERIDNEGKHLNLGVGASLAIFVLILAIGLGWMLARKSRNKKLVVVHRSNSVLPRISFSNPIIRNMDHVAMSEQPELVISQYVLT